MTDIKAGDEIAAGWWPPAIRAESTTDIDNVTATTPQAGSPTVDVQFTSPLSGRVAVCIQGGIDQDSADDRLFINYEMYEGSSAAGTLVRDSRSSFGISSQGGTVSDELIQGNMTMVSGLTPGVTHFARVVHYTEGVSGTNDVTFRRIIVFPLP